MFRRFLTVILSLVALAACSGQRQAEKLARHWDGYDFSSVEGFSDIEEAQTRFGIWCELLAEVPADVAESEIRRISARLAENEISLYVYYEMFAECFYSLESPFRNERFLDIFLETVLDSGVLSGYEMERARELQRSSRCSREGSRVDDFTVYWGSGAEYGFRALLSESSVSLVMVVDPACPSCREMMRKVEEDKGVTEHLAEGNMQIVAVLADAGAQMAERMSAEMSPMWKIVAGGDGFEMAFDAELSPAYYIISDDATVLRKASVSFPVFP